MFVLETDVLLPQAITFFSPELRFFFFSPHLVLVFGLFYMDGRASAQTPLQISPQKHLVYKGV